MFLKTPKIRASQPATRAITLVEMLISMAVTLVMMAAVVNLFANIGAGVRNRRASMELGSQLRMARSRLFKDLAGATSAARPKLPSDDHDDGYLEIIEGVYSDKNPSALVLATTIDTEDGNGVPLGLQHLTSLVPRDNTNGLVQWDDDDEDGVVDDGSERNSVRSSGSALGDYDDILALTVRSESEPFTGRMPVWQDPDGPGPEPFQWVVTIIESDLAEVIWYSVENPADGSLGEPGMRTVYRRVLLIAPWVDELPPQTVPSGPLTSRAIQQNRTYYQVSDISFRRVRNAEDEIIRVPNTLADLTKRENRFGHFPYPYTGTDATSFPNETNYPHAMDQRAIRIDNGNSRKNFPQNLGAIPFVHPFGTPFEWDTGSFDPANAEADAIPQAAPGETTLGAEATAGADRKGEDVMLNDVLAFDLRVFDPGAPLYAVNDTVLEPSDNGWAAAYLSIEQPAVANAEFDAMVGQGAYVDLGYVSMHPSVPPLPPIPPNPTSSAQPLRPQFAGLPDPKSGLDFSGGTIASVAYDTWPYHYEDDGIDQDEAVDNNTGVDQGTNRLDDIVPYDHDNDPVTPRITPASGVQGVDDASERETQPPYNHPLRAMQAKIRVYDRESRQIREATVTRNFVPQ